MVPTVSDACMIELGPRSKCILGLGFKVQGSGFRVDSQASFWCFIPWTDNETTHSRTM